jgi:hypothetical protein
MKGSTRVQMIHKTYVFAPRRGVHTQFQLAVVPKHTAVIALGLPQPHQVQVAAKGNVVACGVERKGVAS